MWIFTKIGFFSVVQADPRFGSVPGELMVRARVRADLVQLREFGGLSEQVWPILETPDRDYPYRIIIGAATWSVVAGRLAALIDYRNFKSEIAASDPVRAHVYGSVWSEMVGLEGWIKG